MIGKSHVAIGVSSVLLAQTVIPFVATVTLGEWHIPQTMMLVAALGVAAVGALAPDIDHPSSSATRRMWGSGLLNWLLGGAFRFIVGGHRKGTHTIWAVILLSGLSVATHLMAPALGSLALAFTIGYVSHILADCLTKDSVYLLWPVVDKPIHILPNFLRFRTGSLLEYAIVLLVCAFTGWLWLA